MRKLTTAVLLAGTVLLSGGATSEPQALTVIQTAQRVNVVPCAGIKWRQGVEQRERLIRCAAHHWRVPGGAETALRIARCESGVGLDPRAYYHGSAGVFQQQVKYWRERARKYLSSPKWDIDFEHISVYNAWANVVVSFKMAMDKDIGWGPWACA